MLARAVRDFSAKMLKVLSAKTLKSKNVKHLQRFGALKSCAYFRVTRKGVFSSVEYKCQFAKAGELRYRIVFRTTEQPHKIYGLWVKK